MRYIYLKYYICSYGCVCSTKAFLRTKNMQLVIVIKLIIIIVFVIQVKFTDVDYRVYSDAAKLVADGYSPFDRPTYRFLNLT